MVEYVVVPHIVRSRVRCLALDGVSGSSEAAAQAVRRDARGATRERTRIARELHDTLLQSFHGLLLRFQTASYLLPARPANAKDKLDSAIERAAKAITEGRDAVQGLRASTVGRTTSQSPSGPLVTSS